VNAKRAGEPTVSRGSISSGAPSAGLSASLIVVQLAIVAVELGKGIAAGSTARKAMSWEGEYQSCLAGVVEPVLLFEEGEKDVFENRRKKRERERESEFFFPSLARDPAKKRKKEQFSTNKKTHRRRT